MGPGGPGLGLLLGQFTTGKFQNGRNSIPCRVVSLYPSLKFFAKATRKRQGAMEQEELLLALTQRDTTSRYARFSARF